MAFQLTLLSGFVLLGLRDDGVDGDGRLTGRTVTNDQLTLTATDGNHRIDGHDPGLHRNGHGLPGNDARSEFFDGILGLALDLALAIDGLTQSINHAAKETLADRNGKQATRGLDLVTGLDAFAVTEKHAADFGLFQVQRQAIDTTWKLNHFVEHDVAQAFHLGGTITDFADDADVGFRDCGLETCDLGFDLLKDVAHGVKRRGKGSVEKGK